MGILHQKSQELYAKKGKLETVAQADQKHFMSTQLPLEAGLRLMIQGFEQYCRGYEQTGYKVGKDGYSASYAENIARSLIGLLSGPGKFDGGTLDSTIREICNQAAIELE